MEEEPESTFHWVMERATGSLAIFFMLALLRSCWTRMRSSQRLALGEAFEAKRDPLAWMGSATERKSLLSNTPRGVRV